jgi:hypothetical protein
VAASVTGLGRGASADVEVEVGIAQRRLLTEGGRPIPPQAQNADRYRRDGLTVAGSAFIFIAKYASRDVTHRDATLEIVGAGGVVRRLPIQVENGVGSVQPLGVDTQGQIYVLVTEMLPGQDVRVDRTVRRYTSDGMLVAVARVPVIGRYMAPERDVILGPDGQVYALLVLSDHALVIRLGFVDQLPSLANHPTSSLAAALASLSVPQALAAPQPSNELAAIVRMADRNSALSTASAFYNHTWWCNASNYNTCSGSIRPAYITTPNATYYEIPYQWGGYRSLSQFDGDMSANKTAGDMNTNAWKSCASGVDCSGFVQNCWGQMSQKYNDTHLKDYFCTGSVSSVDLLAADMWRLAGQHVRLHHYYGFQGSDLTGAYVYESADASGQRVWYRFYDWNGLNGYVGWRWRGY